jgi:hypothetical protein
MRKSFFLTSAVCLFIALVSTVYSATLIATWQIGDCESRFLFKGDDGCFYVHAKHCDGTEDIWYTGTRVLSSGSGNSVVLPLNFEYLLTNTMTNTNPEPNTLTSMYFFIDGVRYDMYYLPPSMYNSVLQQAHLLEGNLQ